VPDQTIQSWGTILQVLGGKVIAVDQNNNPALVVNTVGRGKTLLSAYPLEHYLANAPAVFDQPENTHRIYEAFRDWAGFKPAFRADDPAIETSALDGDHRGYLVLVNHSAESKDVTVSAAAPLHAVKRIEPQGTTTVSPQGSAFKIQLDAYEGTILEWK
jgi:endo-1,4-beta-mannosidase